MRRANRDIERLSGSRRHVGLAFRTAIDSQVLGCERDLVAEEPFVDGPDVADAETAAKTAAEAEAAATKQLAEAEEAYGVARKAHDALLVTRNEYDRIVAEGKTAKAERSVEAQLSGIYSALGADLPAPTGTAKEPYNYVGRVIASIFSIGIYLLWWPHLNRKLNAKIGNYFLRNL